MIDFELVCAEVQTISDMKQGVTIPACKGLLGCLAGLDVSSGTAINALIVIQRGMKMMMMIAMP